jgi:quinol monooxygenase YgiN|tara:strand:+ start:443 stop:772 length:330 start_codon:yes stop_codon:yes gene_type:complete
MPIARYWVVKTGGNEVTEDMANVWKENFLDYAMQNGCLRGALVADDERIIAVSMWPDMATLEAVVESDHYSVIGEAVGASWGAGGIDLSEDIEFVCNGDVLAMMVPGGM